jgi:hypothetical protein
MIPPLYEHQEEEALEKAYETRFEDTSQEYWN